MIAGHFQALGTPCAQLPHEAPKLHLSEMPYVAALGGSAFASVLCLFCWGPSSSPGLSLAAERCSCCGGLLASCCLSWLADLHASHEVDSTNQSVISAPVLPVPSRVELANQSSSFAFCKTTTAVQSSQQATAAGYDGSTGQY